MPNIYIAMAETISKVDNKKLRAKVGKVAIEVAGSDWNWLFQAFVSFETFSDPLFTFYKLDILSKLQPQFLILHCRIKLHTNFLILADKLSTVSTESLVSFLSFATNFAFQTDEKKHEIISGFGILPPDCSILKRDKLFSADFSPDSVSKQAENLSIKKKLYNPFLEHFVGVEHHIRAFCDSYKAGELERQELLERIYLFCTNGDSQISLQIVAYLDIEIPELAYQLSLRTGGPIVQRVLAPHHTPWKEIQCTESPTLHNFDEGHSFMVASQMWFRLMLKRPKLLF